ncbi:hypothetical protein CHS0354_002559 [Potamilus streckersoni]|uniref:Uncharacterized protein n=1 Tax=Potamilus streckersoni TaxID=2493646 RepID=A0AAE0RLS1_9BIVA|nr:hypothetical protein CHS0354_002559 [Potamilus streckersoni]
MASYCTSSNDLSCLPDIYFAVVENFITDVCSSARKEKTTKGFKYYSEGCIHSFKSCHFCRKALSSTCSYTTRQGGACGRGYDHRNPHPATKCIKSTRYNPIPEDAQFNASELAEKVKDFNMLFPPVFNGSNSQQYIELQAKNGSDYILNVMDIDTFIELLSINVITYKVVAVLTENQTVKFDTLTVIETESMETEKNTRLQSKYPSWHSIRKNRIMTSNAGDIANR